MKKLPLLVVAGFVSVLAGCSGEPAPVEPVRAVKLVKVESGPVAHQQTFAGDVRARIESRLGFRVGGKLIQRPAETGQRVRSGQLLAQLDPSDLALASQAAQAQVVAAQTQRDLTAADLKRYTDLQAKGFVSSAEIERRQAALDAAEASLRQARAQGAVQGNQASYARLLADGPGVVVAVEAEVGQVVAAGTPVVRVARDGARDAVFAVPEDRLPMVRVGQVAQVRLWSSTTAQGEGAAVDGVIREVAASADPVTRTYQVKVALPDSLAAPLGATAYVTLSAKAGAPQPAIRLPSSALVQSDEGDKKGSAVWVFDPASSTVQQRPVVVDGADGNQILIASGLQPGDEVVVAGTHVLSPGQKVTRFAGGSAQ